MKFNPYIFQMNDSRSLIFKSLCQDAHSLTICSTPTWHPLERGSPNFLKCVQEHPDIVVNGNFLQYNFFPWNTKSEPFYNFFIPTFNKLSKLTLDLYHEKTIPLHLNATKSSPRECFDNEYFFRISYQVFPTPKGFLSKHSDPVGRHQACAPIVNSMDNSSESRCCGLSIQNMDGKMVNYQHKLDFGDTIFFDSGLPHEMSINNLPPFSDIHHFLLSVHAYRSTQKQLKSIVVD